MVFIPRMILCKLSDDECIDTSVFIFSARHLGIPASGIPKKNSKRRITRVYIHDVPGDTVTVIPDDIRCMLSVLTSTLVPGINYSL